MTASNIYLLIKFSLGLKFFKEAGIFFIKKVLNYAAGA